jgi:hypothetical protein
MSVTRFGKRSIRVSEEIGDADEQQTNRSNKQNFEAHNARPHGGAINERPRGMQRALAGFEVAFGG